MIHHYALCEEGITLPWKIQKRNNTEVVLSKLCFILQGNLGIRMLLNEAALCPLWVCIPSTMETAFGKTTDASPMRICVAWSCPCEQRQWKPETTQSPGLLFLVSFFPAFKRNMQTTLHTRREISILSKISECDCVCSNHRYDFWELLCFGHNIKLVNSKPPSHITSISVTAAHFQPATPRQYELASFFPAVPSQREDPTSLWAGHGAPQILDQELQSQASRRNKLSVCFEV